MQCKAMYLISQLYVFKLKLTFYTFCFNILCMKQLLKESKLIVNNCKALCNKKSLQSFCAVYVKIIYVGSTLGSWKKTK